MSKLKDPIFICGEGRSGTKLLRDTLARHSAINFFRCESYIFVDSKIHRIKNLDIAEKSEDLNYLTNSVIACLTSKNKNLAAKAIKEKDFSQENQDLALELEENHDLKFDTLDIFDKAADLLTHKARKERWLEKTPYHVYYIDKIFSRYKEAKVILTIRDPKAIYASWKKKDSNKSLLGVINSWNKVAEELLKTKGKNVFVVYFEDLITHPKETLEKLCKYIDEDFEDALLNAEVVNSKFSENKKKGFDTSIVDRWKGELSPKEIQLIDRLTHQNQVMLGLCPDQEKNPLISPINYLLLYLEFIIKKVKKFFLWLKI